jgi:hypothetical protein
VICEWWETVLVALVLCLAGLAVLILGASTHHRDEDELDHEENQRRLGK